MLSIAVPLIALVFQGCAGEPLFTRGQPGLTSRHTLKELRDLHIVKQRTDYSCGAAALATLLVYYFGEQISEEHVLKLLESGMTEEERAGKAQRGFSLLDLKKVSQTLGYRAAGFKLTMEQATRLKAPVIVFVEPLGYKHFAVLRGIDRGRVFVADPSRGNLRMGVGRFLQEWHGIVFVVSRKGEEQLPDYGLALSHPLDIQPEIQRFNAQLDLGMYTRTLPLR